jgi:hypothetical protein
MGNTAFTFAAQFFLQIRAVIFQLIHTDQRIRDRGLDSGSGTIFRGQVVMKVGSITKVTSATAIYREDSKTTHHS